MATNGKLQVAPDDVVSVEGRLDWLTVTAKSREAREELWHVMSAYKTTAILNGETPQKWHFKGYAGLSMFGFRWGTRLDSDIVMLSGQDANDMFTTMGDYAENVTRIDLAVTCTLGKPYENVAKICYKWALDNLKNSELRKRKLTFFENSEGGQTLYVGSRASDQMGRLYDKARESGIDDLAGKLWRYEVEFKAKRAKAIFDRLFRRVAMGDAHTVIMGTVFDWFNARDVPPMFDKLGPSLSLEVEARVTSDEIKLAWLSEQVRPTVARLIRNGKIEQVFYALELMEPMPLDKRNL